MNVRETQRGVQFEVKVTPRSSRNEIAGYSEGVIKVKLTAVPVEGEANQALISFLAEICGVARKNVTILKGETSRRKLVEISGLGKTEFLKRIGFEP